MPDTVVTLARQTGPRGEVVLRRRTGEDGPVEELIVNGAFAMDSQETSTERRLAEFAVRAGSDRVLVGGLGLGYTAAEILTAGVNRVDVVEIEECLIHWARAGLTPTLAAVAADPRAQLYAADVRRVLTESDHEPRGPWNAIVLDVDNGPDFLIHPTNEALYAEPGLRAAYDRLTPGGTLVIWCQGPVPELLARLRSVSGQAREHRFRVTRGDRGFAYAIYTLDRPGAQPSAL